MEKSTLRRNASPIAPQLKFSAAALGFSMEGIEVDQLLVRFWDLDPSDNEAEASFVLDTSNQHFRGAFTAHRTLSLANVVRSPHLVTKSTVTTHSCFISERDG